MIMSVIQDQFQSEKYFMVTLTVNQQAMLQFAPNNSIGRHIATLSLSLLYVWSLQKCTNILILCRQTAALAHHSYMPGHCTSVLNNQIHFPLQLFSHIRNQMEHKFC